MARVITLSQKFLKDHPRAGEPTHFVEKVLNSLSIDYCNWLDYYNLLLNLNRDKIESGKLSKDQIRSFTNNLKWCHEKKLHTIRAGHRFQTGEKVQLAVWSGKPYCSPQIRICPELEVVCYDFEVERNTVPTGPEWMVSIGDYVIFDEFDVICKNDGLSIYDFKHWFKYPSDFDGQIICWKDPKY